MNKVFDRRQSVEFISIETCAYSGATLLAFLLGSHDRVATIGEMDGVVNWTKSYDEYLCSCGQRITKCRFWREIETIMRRKGVEFDGIHFNTKCDPGGPWFVRRLRSASFRNRRLSEIRDVVLDTIPGESKKVQTLILRNEALVEAVLHVTGKDHFVDSSKDLLRLKYMLRYSSFEMRIIHLVRDVRGVVASHLHHRESLTPCVHQRRSLVPRVIAKFWVKQNEKLERLLEGLPRSKWIRIRYDDLCLDTQGTLDQLCQFLQIEPAVVGDFRSAPHHILGNEMRLRQVSEIKLDERWKNMLKSDDLKTIKETAGALNRKYGYV